MASRIGSSTDRKQQSHERIVDAAARALRARGYAGVGVADVMRTAGLTHGGFYAHFASRDALLVAAIEHAGRRSAEVLARRTEDALGAAVDGAPADAFRALVTSYLDDNLIAAHDAGCPVAALCAEMSRQEGDVHRASVTRLRALVRHVGRCLPPAHAGDAGVVAATLIGSLQMARALGPNAEGRASLAAARAALLSRYAIE